MITISPGHWHVGTGAKALIDEVTEARKVAKRVVEVLRASGITTNYVEDNVSKNQKENLTYLIAQHAKTSRQVDCFIHFNFVAGGVREDGIGTEVFFKSEKELAATLTSAMANATGLKNRGAKMRNDLAVLNDARMKRAILPEICFVNSRKDVEFYNKNFEALCQAIAKTLAEAVGRKLVEEDGVLYADNGAKIEFDIVEGAKAWRVQSGDFKSKEKAIEFAKKSGFPYNSIQGREK